METVGRPQEESCSQEYEEMMEFKTEEWSAGDRCMGGLMRDALGPGDVVLGPGVYPKRDLRAAHAAPDIYPLAGLLVVCIPHSSRKDSSNIHQTSTRHHGRDERIFEVQGPRLRLLRHPHRTFAHAATQYRYTRLILTRDAAVLTGLGNRHLHQPEAAF